jgi:cell fate regulator YaaT (PSP1 superfamily)
VLCSRKHFALSKANNQRKKMLGLFLVEEKKILFFSTFYHFLPCLIKVKEKNMFFSCPLFSEGKKKRLPL